jgi:hypothetical protein
MDLGKFLLPPPPLARHRHCLPFGTGTVMGGRSQHVAKERNCLHQLYNVHQHRTFFFFFFLRFFFLSPELALLSPGPD